MCGIIGVYGNGTVSRLIYHGLQSLQHRGHSAAGMITYDGNLYTKKEAGFISRLIRGYKNEEDFEAEHPGYVGIAHTRYSTAGADDWTSLRKNAQPEYIVNPFIAACHNGNIYNGNEIMPKLKRLPRTNNDIQFLLILMANDLPSYREINFDTIVEAGTNVMTNVKGSYSTLYLSVGSDKPYLLAMTDPYKVRPLVYGKKDDAWFIASESSSLKRLGITEFKDVNSGSILSFDPKNDGPVEHQIVKKKKHHCMFEYIYFADPDSWIEGISVHKVRVELGKKLYEENPIDADIVVPVPESGRRYAIGYSHASNTPIEEGLRKYKKVRSFILQTQEQRDELAEMNMAAINAAVDGKDVVVTDDSLIRGTNIKKIIKKLRGAGAKKVHVRIGCPPLIAPCYLGIDMRSKKEFIAVDKDGGIRPWDEIAEIVGADSLAYSSMKALRSVIIGDRDDIDICAGCLDFPCGYPEDMQADLKELSKKDADGVRAYEC